MKKSGNEPRLPPLLIIALAVNVIVAVVAYYAFVYGIFSPLTCLPAMRSRSDSAHLRCEFPPCGGPNRRPGRLAGWARQARRKARDLPGYINARPFRSNT
jgi:hypothetical protein